MGVQEVGSLFLDIVLRNIPYRVRVGSTIAFVVHERFRPQSWPCVEAMGHALTMYAAVSNKNPFLVTVAPMPPTTSALLRPLFRLVTIGTLAMSSSF